MLKSRRQQDPTRWDHFIIFFFFLNKMDEDKVVRRSESICVDDEHANVFTMRQQWGKENRRGSAWNQKDLPEYLNFIFSTAGFAIAVHVRLPWEKMTHSEPAVLSLCSTSSDSPKPQTTHPFKHGFILHVCQPVVLIQRWAKPNDSCWASSEGSLDKPGNIKSILYPLKPTVFFSHGLLVAHNFGNIQQDGDHNYTDFAAEEFLEPKKLKWNITLFKLPIKFCPLFKKAMLWGFRLLFARRNHVLTSGFLRFPVLWRNTFSCKCFLHSSTPVTRWK